MATTLSTIIDLIKSAIHEEWIENFEINSETRFNEDLELESIELILIAEKIQKHYGNNVNLSDWFSSLSLDQMIHLTVGQLSDEVRRVRFHG